MKVGLISDSHDNTRALRSVLLELIKHNVELVIHLGDIISPFTLKLMKNLLGNTQVIAVLGNNDGDTYSLFSLFNQYGWTLEPGPAIINLRNRRVLLVHGYGDAENTKKLVEALARSPEVDVLLYGHTHQPYIGQVEHKLVINPGETCGLLTGNISYAVLNLEKMKAELYFIGEAESTA